MRTLRTASLAPLRAGSGVLAHETGKVGYGPYRTRLRYAASTFIARSRS
jgi:hypothetical protein